MNLIEEMRLKDDQQRFLIAQVTCGDVSNMCTSAEWRQVPTCQPLRNSRACLPTCLLTCRDKAEPIESG